MRALPGILADVEFSYGSNMNDQQRIQKNLWRDQTKEAVSQARNEEAARPQADRKMTPKRDFLFQRAQELLKFDSLKAAELETKEFWLKKMILGNRMYAQQRQDATVIAPRFEAWPAGGQIPEWVTKRFAEEQWLWNALALPVQHAISRIRDQQKAAVSAIYKQAAEKGQDTEDENVKKRLSPKIKAALKKVDYSPVRRIEQARQTVLKLADRIRAGKIKDPDTEMRRLGWNTANWNFALAVSKLPAWLQRVVKMRMDAASKARRTRRQSAAGESWYKGYPRPDLDDRGGEGGLDCYFNGQNLTWASSEMKNSYLNISAAWNPPDHRGPRTGKYRSQREMRKVTLREPESRGQNLFTLNVLIHSVPAGARMKGYKLRARRDAHGKLRWFFIPTFELPEGPETEARTFTGIDVGWRKSGDTEFTAVHCWNDARGYRHWDLKIADNRWSRRYNTRQKCLPANEQFLIELTPAGLRDFASRKGALQRDFKAKMKIVLDNAKLLPANWDRIGKRGIARMMTHEKSPEFPALQCLRAEYEAWSRREQELSRIYRAAWGMLSDNLDRQRREIAREILADATDIGIEALDVKQMAEKENEGPTDQQRHIENVQAHSRQLTGPAKFLAILVNAARKMGKRVHKIDPRDTSRQCSQCKHINTLSLAQTFVCAGCGREWNRDENAARNLARLARECADGDTHPRRCSRDGKRIPFHGLMAPRRKKNGQTAGGDGKMLAQEPLADSS
jgi:hypothetical protein